MTQSLKQPQPDKCKSALTGVQALTKKKKDSVARTRGHFEPSEIHTSIQKKLCQRQSGNKYMSRGHWSAQTGVGI